MEEADTEEVSSAMEAAGIGLSREGGEEEDRARGKKDISCLFSLLLSQKMNILFGAVSMSKFNNNVGVPQKLLHFACSVAKRGHF
jgi:hypothetical protein